MEIQFEDEVSIYLQSIIFPVQSEYQLSRMIRSENGKCSGVITKILVASS